MRSIGAASLVFVAAITLAVSGLTPAALAEQSSLFKPAQRHLDGQAIFRFDTFGDEQLWTDTLRMHDAISTVSPAAALALGLKVDVEALPPAVTTALASNQLDLTNPAVTIELLRLNAVVGVKGQEWPSDRQLFILARWGEELVPFAELALKAARRHKAELIAKCRELASQFAAKAESAESMTEESILASKPSIPHVYL